MFIDNCNCKAMLKNYLKTAFRNFYYNKGNSLINIFGLGTALLCCIVIFLYARKELTFDHFHSQSDRIYRLTVQEINRPGARYFATTSPPMGPALFTTETRIREIGIRKVLGATISDILMLLTTDFVKLVLIAFVIAVPAGWFVMNYWLNRFAFHAEPGIGLFLTAGVLALLLSILAISWQSVRAALMNPVDSMRSE